MPPKKKVVNTKQTQKQEQKIVVNIGKPTTTHKKKSNNKPKQKQTKVNNPFNAPIVINTMPQLPPPPQPLAFAPTNNPLYYSTTSQVQQPIRAAQPEVIRNPPPVAQGQPLQPPQRVPIGNDWQMVDIQVPRLPPRRAAPPPQPVRNQPPVGYMQVPPLPPRRAAQQAPPVPPLRPPPNINQLPDIQVPRLPPRRAAQQAPPEGVRNPPPVAQGQPIAPPEARVEAPREEPGTSQQQRPQASRPTSRRVSDETLELERQAQEALSRMYPPIGNRPVADITASFEGRMRNPNPSTSQIGITPITGEIAGIEARNLSGAAGASTSRQVNPDDVKAERLRRLANQLR